MRKYVTDNIGLFTIFYDLPSRFLVLSIFSEVRRVVEMSVLRFFQALFIDGYLNRISAEMVDCIYKPIFLRIPFN